MDQPERPIVDPLEVVDGEKQRTERRKRTMCRLEDPERLARLSIVAAKGERLEARTMLGYFGQPVEDLTDRSEGHACIGLEPNDPDHGRSTVAYQDLRKKAGLPGTGLTRDEGRG
jgi:hypothetical protein